MLNYVDMVKQSHLSACGTYEEVNFAISKTIQHLKEKKNKLPYLLEYYNKNYKLINTNINITKRYNEENNLPKQYDEILRKAIFND